MKKICTILFFLTSMLVVMAQMRTVYIYHPGTGEHRGGFSVTPTFGKSFIECGFDNEGTQIASLSNLMGIGIEGFWGYDTEHGNAVEWSSLSSLGLRYQSFGGSVVDALNVAHDVRVAAPMAYFKVTEALLIPINSQLHLGVGIDAMLSYSFTGGVRVDGQKYAKSPAENFLTGFGFTLGAMVEAKYFITDQMYVGTRLGYMFYTFDLRNLLDDESLSSIAGVVGLNQNGNTASSIHLAEIQPFNLSLQLGFRW